MNILIKPEVFGKFPEFARYVIVAENVNNTGQSPELEAMLREAEVRIRSDESFSDIKNNPFIAAWRDAFQKFGVNPNQCPPSVANLIKRTRSGKDLPFISKLVCIFNIMSLTYILPAGGDDLDKVTGDVCLGTAAGDEIYTPLGGGNTESPKPDEIILYDTGNKQVFCRAWCWKNGDQSKIEEQTRRVAINIDVLPPSNEETGAKAAQKLCELLEKHCKADTKLFKLDKNNPSLSV